MLAKTVCALALLALSLQVEALNITYDYYCGKELTCGDIPNIMCNRTTKFPPLCLSPEYIPINDELMQMFLDEHNKLRSQHALGKTGGIFRETTATDMATMAWDDELELMSLHSAVQCELVDDKCRRTNQMKTVGQNTHTICRKPKKNISIGAAVNEAVNAWFSEYEHVTNLEAVQNFDSATTGDSTKHFTQLVQSNADRIGCSIVRYDRKQKGLFNKPYKCTVIGCNYSAGNVNGLPIYKIGASTSQCQSGTNTDYPGLCSPKEDYTRHENAQSYFTEVASPVVANWVKNNKEILRGDHQ